MLDHLACNTLSHSALAHGAAIYDKVAPWARDKWMWTRRASISPHRTAVSP